MDRNVRMNVLGLVAAMAVWSTTASVWAQRDISGVELIPPDAPHRVIYSVQSARAGKLAHASTTGVSATTVGARSVPGPPDVLTSAARGGSPLESTVYRERARGGFAVFLNFNPATGAAFPGAMLADNLGLGGGFGQLGERRISGYDLLVFRSSFDPQPGLADIHVELWDGDPLCLVDTPGGGFACAPIAGTTADFVDIPSATVPTLRAQLPAPVLLSPTNTANRVWMVITGSQTSNASPCRLGWIIGEKLPEIGNAEPGDMFELQWDTDGETNGQGRCCEDGSACVFGSPAECPGDRATGGNPRGLCSDADAEDAQLTFFGGPCDGGANDFCANFVASVFSPAATSLSLIPMGTGPDGSLIPGATIAANEITLPRGGTTVFLEVRIGDWDRVDNRCVGGTNDGAPCLQDDPANPDRDCPDMRDAQGQIISDGTCGTALRAVAARLDRAGMTGGLQGELTPALVPCTIDEECTIAFGGACSESQVNCSTDADCPGTTDRCEGSRCDFTPGAGGFCQPAFISRYRSDFPFPEALAAAQITQTRIGFGSASAGDSVHDPDPFPVEGLHGGTLVLDVPSDAHGTFTLDWQVTSTGMIDANNFDIPLLGLVPGLVTVRFGQCCFDLAGNPECVDGVTQAACDALPGPRGFRDVGSCLDPLSTCDCNGNAVFDGDDLANGTSADCNGNGVPDECETDCNGNGVPDDCDVAAGTSGDCNGDGVPDECGADCNGNGIPDVCDIVAGTSVDLDGNGVPDECECPPGAARPEPAPLDKVRYLSLVPGNAGQQVALRVTFAALPGEFAALNGRTMWVGPPREVSNLGGSRDATPPTLTVARLQCEPFFTDWDTAGTIHLYHQNIVPGATYSVQAIDVGCDLADESSYSPLLALSTSRWADLTRLFNDGAWPAPDGLVNVITDAVAVLDAFANRRAAPRKPRADLGPATPDQLITISDITDVLGAFRGRRYPFAPDLTACP
ncbi:MAG: hypothetical protein ACE5EX_03940 [Phycisphaerae bacterium]